MGTTNTEESLSETIATEQTVDIPPFDFFGFMAEHWWKYILILAFLIYIYNKVFRARKLPLLKDAVIYVTMAVGAFVLLIFQTDAGLPILQSLAVAVVLMVIVRVRYAIAERRKKQ